MVAYLTALEEFLINQGYWIRAFHTTIVLTDADREAIHEPQMHDVHIAALGYSLRRNELLWVDAQQTRRGAASIGAFTGQDSKGAAQFRLFTDRRYRDLLSLRLGEQMVQAKYVLPGASVRLGLLSHIDPTSEGELDKLFQENNWLLFDESKL